MKYTELLTTNNSNPGDIISDMGARLILDDLYEHNYFVPCHYSDPEMIDDFRESFLPEVSAVVGTPWIWARAHQTPKYKCLEAFLKREDTIKIALSIGSCYDFKFIKAQRCKTNLWNQFDLIVCRDIMAYEFLRKRCGDKVLFLPCTSSYLVKKMPEYIGDRDNLLIYQNLKTSLMSDKVRFRDDFYQSQFDFYNEGADVMVVHEEDQIEFNKIFPGVECELFKNPIDIYDHIRHYKKVLTPRVHCSIPALSYGIDVTNVPSDSRCLTAINLGATVAPRMKQYLRYPDRYYQTTSVSKESYVEKIKEVLHR